MGNDWKMLFSLKVRFLSKEPEDDLFKICVYILLNFIGKKKSQRADSDGSWRYQCWNLKKEGSVEVGYVLWDHLFPTTIRKQTEKRGEISKARHSRASENETRGPRGWEIPCCLLRVLLCLPTLSPIALAHHVILAKIVSLVHLCAGKCSQIHIHVYT